MTHEEALAEAQQEAWACGTRRTVRGLRFREGWRYFVYEAGSALDWGIRNGDRRFWENVHQGSPGIL